VGVVMKYISIGIIMLISFIISVVITKVEIPVLKRKAGQNIREDGPQSHLSKAGTPSMGGIAIIIAASLTTIGAAVMGKIDGLGCAIILLVFVGFGLIGFFDDYLKVIKKNNLGLRAYQKFGLQTILSVILAVYLANYTEGSTSVYIPFADIYVNFGIWYIPFVVFVVLAMTNAVNLTDGLDGLASGVTAFISLFFAVAGFTYGIVTGAYFCSAMCGACLGFLVFNRNPAKVFMGDTGSLALGGGLAAAAILMKLELLLPIVGLLYVIEALSVVLQVGYFKISGGKRIFKMAPIHHHFEKCGFSEVQVVAGFWIFAVLCCVAGFFII
ncbi:MAG: phospho-N-acetylmuramoyl-pentapeptide-transferase, partial [Clostridia bacterium]